MAVWEYIKGVHAYKMVDFTVHWMDKWYAKFHDFSQSPCVCVACTSPERSKPKKNCTAFTKINCIFLSNYYRYHHTNVCTGIRYPRDCNATKSTVAKGIFIVAEQNCVKCVTCALPFWDTVQHIYLFAHPSVTPFVPLPDLIILLQSQVYRRARIHMFGP